MIEIEPDEFTAANYQATGVSRFKGNPFIEALPQLEDRKLDFLEALAHYPEMPTAATRKSGEMIRLMEMNQINDIVVPFAEYEQTAVAMANMLRDSYVARHPDSPSDRRRRHALATQGRSQMPFPSDWRTSGSGHLLIAISGMGKTTLAKAFLLRYQQLIVHQSYCGKALRCVQVPHLSLRVPHDGTLRGLCLQFFDVVDRLLGTEFRKEALALRSIAPMALQMTKVASALSLGLLVIDELQNLRYAMGKNAEYVLNLISDLIEHAGTSVLTIATPAVQPVIEGSIRNGRKMASAGQTVLRPMTLGDPQWKLFCETYWDYTYTKRKPRLSKEILKAWHRVSAGNSAFAATAFGLAQRHAIGTTECIDEAAFFRVAEKEMAFLQPAIEALNSGNPSKLRQFDDLVFSERFRALRSQLGVATPPINEPVDDEFDDIPEEEAPEPAARSRQTRPSGNLKTEEPRELN
ncbi:ATP-binding protein [Rhizobacter sp. AJA081-3]|uniref:ATP-binding protein n=1 Tax=Rhizobacter sp. AJA081-3 TaxID=2753607 RepID=UPI001ADF3CFD|nr:ATP-binding protein [Rhizobacter sp. AJA081-3]QTN22213.1 ATP-binding protein [Rhizobacter sp. AJA081-3]